MASLVDHPVQVTPDSPQVARLAEQNVANHDAARTLAIRALLHLPRISDAAGLTSFAGAAAEVARLALEETTAPEWMRPPPLPVRRADELRLTALEESRARVITERLHYLRSHRPGSLHLAGMAHGHLAVALSFSRLDVGAIATQLPEGVDPSETLVLSRVYGVAWAPPNALSRLLALAGRWLRERKPRVRLLLTYLNPNLGFDGASYRAANWLLYGRETGTRYAYLDAAYITDRELTRRFGTSDVRTLGRLLGDRVAFSTMPLAPLELHAFPVDRRLRRTLAEGPPRRWSRPWA